MNAAAKLKFHQTFLRKLALPTMEIIISSLFLINFFSNYHRFTKGMEKKKETLIASYEKLKSVYLETFISGNV